MQIRTFFYYFFVIIIINKLINFFFILFKKPKNIKLIKRFVKTNIRYRNPFIIKYNINNLNNDPENILLFFIKEFKEKNNDF